MGDHCIRSYRPADVEALVRYADSPKVAACMTDRFPHPYSAQAASEWLELVQAQEVETLFALADQHELIGSIGLEMRQDVYCRSAEIGYWLGEPFWGQGIATSAVVTLTEFAFDNLVDLERIQAHVFSSNPASARVLEKAGYGLEGRLRRSVFKNGQLLDQWVYARLRQVGSGTPA